MFISVDLPAPFSPSRQWISPGSIVRSMWSLAVNDPNFLVRPLISSFIAVPPRSHHRAAEPGRGKAPPRLYLPNVEPNVERCRCDQLVETVIDPSTMPCL